MNWVGVLVVIGFVLWVIGKASSGPSKSGRSSRASNRQPVSYSKEEILAEAQEIADKVKTAKQYEALEARLEKAQDRVCEVESDRAIANAERKVAVLEEALGIAETKTLAWQFVPNFDLDTPLKHLQKAYKVFSLNQYEKARGEIVGDDNEWLPMDYWNLEEQEDQEPELKPLMKFRKIVEAKLPQDEMIKQIDSLVSMDEILAEFFPKEGVLSAGQWWFSWVLKDDGLPKAEELYLDGYTTPEACLAIDPEEFLTRDGVGAKTVEKLKAYQDKVRERQGEKMID